MNFPGLPEMVNSARGAVNKVKAAPDGVVDFCKSGVSTDPCPSGIAKMLSPAFKQPPADLTLEADDVHVWLGSMLQPPAEIALFMELLGPEERERAARYLFEEDRKRFIIRHGMLRILLSRYLGMEASRLRLHHGEHGKPALTETDEAALYFNLSHSDAIALFAFSRDYELGVDIERIREISEMKQIVARYFSAGEKLKFNSTPRHRKKEAFFNCWTRKEAFIKATGEGLSRPLDGFDTMAAPGSGDQTTWKIYTLGLGQEYAGSLAANCNNLNLWCFRWLDSSCSAVTQ
jgi:4'-phosphopantetheinyl transferase